MNSDDEWGEIQVSFNLRNLAFSDIKLILLKDLLQKDRHVWTTVLSVILYSDETYIPQFH